MNVRVCTNPACATIQPFQPCHLCNYPTSRLPSLSLTPIGIDGQATLLHFPTSGYQLHLDTNTQRHSFPLSLSDLIQHAQPLLRLDPHPHPLSPEPNPQPLLLRRIPHHPPPYLHTITYTLHLLRHTLKSVDCDALIAGLSTQLADSLALLKDPPEDL